ncbi:rhodopsin [Trichoplax sp. H2]|nr:rhodopsin [Trichoplax sp. H2]|eukprot:RDD36366.1 rhodopsin [Trichoplax sp. H2]
MFNDRNQSFVGYSRLEYKYYSNHTALELPISQALIVIWTMYLFSVFGGHAALLAAVISVSRKRISRIEVLIINLSIADLIFVTFSIFTMTPIATYSIYRHDPIFASNSIQCRLLFAPVLLSTCVGSIVMMTLAIIRYTKVSYPIYHRRWFTTIRFWIWLCFIWVIALGITAPPVVGFWGKLNYLQPFGVCHIPVDVAITRIDQSSFFIFFCIALYIAAYFITGLCYFLLFCKARNVAFRTRVNPRVNQFPQSSSSSTANDSSAIQLTYKLTIILVIVFIGYSLSFGPLAFTIICSMFKLFHLSLLSYAILFTIAYITSVINPLLFILSNIRYQLALSAIWKKLCCRSKCYTYNIRKVTVRQRIG